MNVLAGDSNHANLTPCHLRNPCTLDLAAATFLLTGVGHACSSFTGPAKGTFHQKVQLRLGFSSWPGAAHLHGRRTALLQGALGQEQGCTEQ